MLYEIIYIVLFVVVNSLIQVTIDTSTHKAQYSVRLDHITVIESEDILDNYVDIFCNTLT